MGADPRLDLVEHFFEGTGFSYDRIVQLFTLGLDSRWKKRIIHKLHKLQKPPKPHRILDLACGTGILTFDIARRFSDCHVVGVELREEYLGIARQKAATLNLPNIEFILSRAEDLELDEPFDCITSSYLAKYADLKRLLPNLAGMLSHDGMVLFHDFTYPSNPILAAGWELYFKLMQRIGSRRHPEWRNVFYGLPELLRQTTWPQDLRTALAENGFRELEIESLTLGASALVTAKRPLQAATAADRRPAGSPPD